MSSFVRFFESISEEPFSAQAVTPTDIRDYGANLQSEDARKPASISSSSSSRR